MDDPKNDPTFPSIVECLASLKRTRLGKSRVMRPVPPHEPPTARQLSAEQQDLLNRAIEASSKIDRKSPVTRSTIDQVKEANALWNAYAASLTPRTESPEEFWRRLQIERAWKQE